MINRVFNKGRARLLWGLILTLSLLSSLLLSFATTSGSYAVSQPYDVTVTETSPPSVIAGVTVTRTLPSSVIPGQTFDVTVTFTAPADNFNALGLSDFAPAGWTVAADKAWNTPNSDTKSITGNRVDYIWYGPFANGTAFTAVYHVTVPANTTPGIYSFTNSSPAPHLEYYVGGGGPYDDNIGGQNRVTINAASSTTALTSSLNPSTYGQSVTFTATVSAVIPATGTPTGVVTFKEGTTTLGTSTLDGTGKATYVIYALSLGNHTLSAAYGGDASLAYSTSPVLTQTVNQSGGGGGGGGGGSSAPPKVYPSGFLVNTPLSVNSSGVLQNAAKLQTGDGKLSLEISNGTKLLNSSNSALTSLNLAPLASPPQVPAGNAIILVYAFSPDGAKFDPALTITIAYDPAKLPSGIAENDLYIAYFDGTQWQKLETTVDPLTKTVTAKVSHFSDFALMGKVSLPQSPTIPIPLPTKMPVPSTIVQPTTTPAAIAPPTTAAPAATPSTTTPSTTPSHVKSSGTHWGMTVAIITGVIIVLLIVAFVVNKRRHK